jgi:gluconolactonase
MRTFVSFALVAASLSFLSAPIATAQGRAVAASGTEVVRLDPALDALILPGTPIEKVADGFVFTEGPMWREGRLWFSDEEGGKVDAVTPGGEVSTLVDYTQAPYARPDGEKTGPNAMATAKDGSVILLQQYGRAVVRLIEHDGKVQPVPFFQDYEGKRLNSPNDLVFAKDGSFYFTDPPYGLKGRDADPAKELPFDGVFHYKNGRLTPVIKDLTLPNGLALSPDGKVLYVNNSGPEMRVLSYDVLPDGTVKNERVLLAFTGAEGRGVPDGMKIDVRGDIWTTGPGGIRIVQPDGHVLGQLKLPQTAANLAWGEDGKTLYITAQGTIYRIRTNVMGELPEYRR